MRCSGRSHHRQQLAYDRLRSPPTSRSEGGLVEWMGGAKVRLHILSDLHIEFAPFEPTAVDADLVVLAGDIHVGTTALQWARNAFPNKQILFVPGNHEFYG